MTPKHFNQIVANRLREIKSVLASKGNEYGSIDRLHNFKTAARINDETPLQSAWGMATKHLVCVMDMVKGDTPITPYMVDEKVGDMINYLIIMEAIMIEEMERNGTDAS